MKRLISLAVAVMLITLLGVCRSRAYDEYNLTDLAACSSVKSDSNGKGGFVCAFSGNTVFSARLVPDFSAYSFSVGGRIRSVSQSGNYTYALVFDDAFTNKYSVYSLNLDNGNVSQNTFVDENFMTNSFSVTDNRIYYIKTDSLKSYVACRDFSSDKKSKITFSDNVNEVFNNNGKSYARLCDGSIYKLSQSSSTYVANTGELKNIYNAGINRVINEDGFIVSLSDNSRNYVSNATAENVYKADGTIAKSGKLKTGFTAVIDSKTYVIAVCGDVTGEGNVNSKDVTLLQKYLCDNAELGGAYLKAADFNLDGEADNRDLVLISRQKN